MARETKTMPGLHCSGCGWDVEECGGLVKRGAEWICDRCEAWEREADELDIEGYEIQRRERLAEAQEY